MKFPVSIKGVLLEHGSVVLLENDRSEWELPGGRLEPGETPKGCLAREISEELGCSVEVGPLLDCWVYQGLPEGDVVIVTFGVHRRSEGPFRISNEHAALTLASVDQLSELALPVGYRRAIHRWTAMQKF
jgi:8-oxo-dGTP pyrophosphatase MutT (NUDIX family)